MKRSVIKTLIIGISSGVAGSLFTVYLMMNILTDPQPQETQTRNINYSTSNIEPLMESAGFPNVKSEDYDFVNATNNSKRSVVFIQTLSEYEYRTGSWLDWFFEPRSSQRVGSGSGVILTGDGYIVTNNHVVDGADKIKVIYGKRSFDAELIGTDPSTDLAVIKIDENDLPAIKIGNSDEVNVGEWVLAVGNPFNLNSTVTAGIVSAKGRNINILRDKFPIESFIQTDAAINPGNSGGALVNMDGELIGINTAILSQTGSYAGYGFAIPSGIVSKVFEDIKNYGEVQKAFVGAEFVDIDSELADKMDLKNLSGVIVANVQREGASETKLKKGDVIRSIDNRKVHSKAVLEEYVGNLYPGDKIELELERDGTKMTKTITLTNREGTTGIIRRDVFTSEWLNATFEAVPKVERELLGIKSGVRVVDYSPTGVFAELKIPEGFIITNINNVAISSPKELSEILEKIKGRVIIAGIDKRSRKVYYPYYF